MCALAVSVGLSVQAFCTQTDDNSEQTMAKAPAITFSLIDLNGTIHSLEQNDSRRVRAFVFVSTECPISNGYIKTLNEIHAMTAKSGKVAELFGVVSDPTVTRTQALKHFSEFKVEFPILFDSSGLLAQVLKPSHIPEAFVLDRDGKLAYRGAIDNSWEAIGRRRLKAEKEFLADTIKLASNGKLVVVAETKPVGCLFEMPPKGGEKAKVTYTRDIAPIIQTRCLNCHRDGQVAPFALAD
jgi:hypothetical protein